ncbi:hypothetical protein LOD99_3063 [Oopsacas minuta]|uniref:Uncharacterized protein n=1 Tax=Oopsacas minuta TaxID=111878 RepID=A0AAV7JY96_9METZ|nr:hypothetical protein LOD99_3063 [Oopsacas minuta]
MKQFIKALNKDGTCFNYLCSVYRGLSIEKLKAGIFDGPQIRKLIKDEEFASYMTGFEASAWYSFVDVVMGFLGNTKVANYQNLVQGMLKNFHSLGTRMNIKLHYLYSHLERFPENLGDLSEEQSERFQRDIWTMEEQYLGRRDDYMLADYCRSLMRDCPQNHTRGIRIREHLFMIDKYLDHIISQIICLLGTFNSSYNVIHTYYMVSVNTDSRMLKNIILQYHEK